MEMGRGISRRRMLAMSAAAGGIALGGDVGCAFAQTDKRIEQLAPELDKIIATSEPIQELADGFGGPLGPGRGAAVVEGRRLPAVQRHPQQPAHEVHARAGRRRVVLEPTNRANGLTRDLQGRLLACEHDSRRVTRRELDGSLTVIANSFQGRRLNRPNDVVVKSDGCDLLHRSVEQPGRARAVGPDLLRRLPRHARSRHAEPAGRRFRLAQRARLLAGRERALHQRYAARPHPRLRRCCPTARWRSRPTGCSPICAAASPACPTA